MNKLICPGCDLPMVDGQVFNGLYACHWDCTEKVRNLESDQRAEQIIADRRESDTEKARQVLGLVVERVDAQFAKLEELVAQLPDDKPSHPIYSCLVDSRDSIACYDTKGAEGKPGFAICALHPVEQRTVSSVVLDVEDSQALSDQLVSFLVGQMPDPDPCMDFQCDSFDEDGFHLESNGDELVMSVWNNTSTVHMGRHNVTALRDRLNQFLEATK